MIPSEVAGNLQPKTLDAISQRNNMATNDNRLKQHLVNPTQFVARPNDNGKGFARV